jgi:Conserved in the green lineage and diatoms 27
MPQETGWYDGERFVKPPEVLARDRLLGTYEVSPVIRRLRKTMLSAGGSLVLATVLLVGVTRAGADADGMIGRAAAQARPSQVLANGVLYSKSVRSLEALSEDDDAAATEQAAMKGVPGYCGDRRAPALGACVRAGDSGAFAIVRWRGQCSEVDGPRLLATQSGLTFLLTARWL